jgi:hypothetical protein
MNDITIFLERLRTTPEKIQFAEVIDLIDTHYDHTPSAFVNGEATNQASENQGSAKVFSFARLNSLNETETLHCFAEHFRAVSANPTGHDHQNIRQFIANGWDGIQLPNNCLTSKY